MAFSLGLYAQDGQDDGSVIVIYPDNFKITRPLIDLINESPAVVEDDGEEKPEMPDKATRRPYLYVDNPAALPKENEDPAWQRTMGYKTMLPPIVNWQGLSGNGTPPDPTGAAGPNHYIQAVNCQWRVWNKTGTAQTSTATLGALLFGVNNGDPIFLYDKTADRWFVSQFKYSSPYKVYIGISQTNDPTGSYYTWEFSSTQLPDYLKFAIWHDGYYMTSNQMTQKIVVFERSVMIAGGASPRMIVKTQTFPTGGGFFCPLAADADGQLPPAGTPCPIFTYTDDGWGGSYTDAVKVYEATTNWTGTPSVTITNVATLNALPFDASYSYSWLDIPQPGTSQKLDGIGGVFTFRAQHRCWTGYNSVVLCMGVKISSSLRGIRWFELRKNTSTNAWSIYQQGTYAPDSYYRWCGSIAMDDNGSIGMAYSVSGSSTVYPSIRYTGRNASDPLGQMTYAEQTAVAGTSSQSGIERWGDYSHTSLDPSDGTVLWHTGEYYSSGQKTRIFSFSIPVPAGIESAQQNAGFTVYMQSGKLMVEAEQLPSNNNMVVDLFDINGKLLEGRNIQPVNNSLETSFDISGLAAGTYLVRLGEPQTSFQKVEKVIIQ